MSPLARVLDRFVWFYQRVTAGRPSPCRFDPSCSTYAREALVTHGGIRGSWLTVRRLLRCNPWGGQGYDPVPAARRSIHDHSCSAHPYRSHSSRRMIMHADPPAVGAATSPPTAS